LFLQGQGYSTCFSSHGVPDAQSTTKKTKGNTDLRSLATRHISGERLFEEIDLAPWNIQNNYLGIFSLEKVFILLPFMRSCKGIYEKLYLEGFFW